MLWTLNASLTAENFSSPGFGSGITYAHNLNCTWLITAPPGTRIQLRYSSEFYDFIQLSIDGNSFVDPGSTADRENWPVYPVALSLQPLKGRAYIIYDGGGGSKIPKQRYYVHDP